MIRSLVPFAAVLLLAAGCHHRTAISPEAADVNDVHDDEARLEALLAKAKGDLPCPERCSEAQDGCDKARTICDRASANKGRSDLQATCGRAQEGCASLNAGCARCSAAPAPATMPSR